MAKRWFRPKRYGWGWYPAAWQGWAVLAAHLCVVGLASWLMAAHEESDAAMLVGMLIVLLSTGGLIAIAYRTGDKPGWRWGGKDED